MWWMAAWALPLLPNNSKNKKQEKIKELDTSESNLTS
jgi:hypothetical protein